MFTVIYVDQDTDIGPGVPDLSRDLEQYSSVEEAETHAFGKINTKHGTLDLYTEVCSHHYEIRDEEESIYAYIKELRDPPYKV